MNLNVLSIFIFYINVLLYWPETLLAINDNNTYIQKNNANNIAIIDKIGAIRDDGISPNASHPAWIIDEAISNCLYMYNTNNIK